MPHLLALESQHEFLLLWPGHDPPEQVRGWQTARSRLVELADVAEFAWDQAAIPLALRREQADVFHRPNGPGGLAVRPRSRLRIVVTLHDVIPLLFPDDYFRNPLHRWFYRGQLWLTARADAVITVSEQAKRDILQHTALRSERVRVIGEGVDPSLVEAAGNADGPEGPYILTLGGAEPRKNVQAVIAAFRRLRDRIPHRLVVVGGPWRGRAPASILDGGNNDRVEFAGAVSAARLAALYRRASLVVFVSRYEGFGLPLLEAMANGTPVIAGNAGALPEVGGPAAAYVAPDDVQGLAQMIAAIAGDEQRRAAMISAGREQVRRYDWKAAALATLQVYESADASARPS